MTRKDVVQESINHGCNQDLKGKGMALSPKTGDIFCVSSRKKSYHDNIESSKGDDIVEYWRIYPKNYTDPLNPNGAESKKNLAVINTQKNGTCVWLYFKPKPTVDDYIFKGKYKMLSYELLVNPADEKKRTNSVKFILQLAEKITNNPTNPIDLRNDVDSNEIVVPVQKEGKNIEELLTDIRESWIPISYLVKPEVHARYGHAGIYIQWSKSKNVYYVGQAKVISRRLEEEYKLEMLGDDLVFVGIETARLDDKEREYIELLKNNGYVLTNKTKGNNPYNK